MNRQDQAFIEAYRNSDAEGPSSVDTAASRAMGTARPNPATVRYRIDAGQVAPPAPAPHAMAFQAPEAAEPRTDFLSVSVATWDVNSVLLPDQSLVMASLIPLPTNRSAVANENRAEADVPVGQAAEAMATESLNQEAPAGNREESRADTSVAADGNVTPAASPPMSFKPVWEVDRFVWPEEVNRLFEIESAYFSYAGNKLREAAREGLRVLAVGSARPGEGCTTLAICLARAAAESGARVALLDGDLDQPHLATRMAVRFPHGWSDTLSGDVPLEEAAITSLEHTITLLPLGDSAAAAAVTFSDRHVSRLIRGVAAGVDLVIVDLGVVSDAEDRCFERGANCPIDAAIVVRDMRHTPASETLAIAMLLKAIGVNAVGIAENYAPPRKTAGNAAA